MNLAEKFKIINQNNNFQEKIDEMFYEKININKNKLEDFYIFSNLSFQFLKVNYQELKQTDYNKSLHFAYNNLIETKKSFDKKFKKGHYSDYYIHYYNTNKGLNYKIDYYCEFNDIYIMNIEVINKKLKSKIAYEEIKPKHSLYLFLKKQKERSENETTILKDLRDKKGVIDFIYELEDTIYLYHFSKYKNNQDIYKDIGKMLEEENKFKEKEKDIKKVVLGTKEMESMDDFNDILEDREDWYIQQLPKEFIYFLYYCFY